MAPHSAQTCTNRPGHLFKVNPPESGRTLAPFVARILYDFMSAEAHPRGLSRVARQGWHLPCGGCDWQGGRS